MPPIFRIEMFYGKHRSLELAERNLRALIRKHGASDGEITERRNALGRFSTRGHFFTFKLTIEEEAEEPEWEGAFDS